MSNRAELELFLNDHVTPVLEGIDKKLSALGGTGGRAMQDVETSTKATGSSIADVFGGNLLSEYFFRGLSAAESFFVTSIAKSQELESALAGLDSIAVFKGIGGPQAESAVQSLDVVKRGLLSVSDASTALKNLLAAGFNLDDSVGVIKELSDAAAFGRQSNLSFGEAVKSAAEGIKNQNSTLVDNAGVTKNLSVILKEAGLQMEDLSDKTKGAAARQALLAGLAKETSGQIGDAGKYSETSAGKMAQLEAATIGVEQAFGQAITRSDAYKASLDFLLNSMQGTTDIGRTMQETFQGVGLTFRVAAIPVVGFASLLGDAFLGARLAADYLSKSVTMLLLSVNGTDQMRRDFAAAQDGVIAGSQKAWEEWDNTRNRILRSLEGLGDEQSITNAGKEAGQNFASGFTSVLEAQQFLKNNASLVSAFDAGGVPLSPATNAQIVDAKAQVAELSNSFKTVQDARKFLRENAGNVELAQKGEGPFSGDFIAKAREAKRVVDETGSGLGSASKEALAVLDKLGAEVNAFAVGAKKNPFSEIVSEYGQTLDELRHKLQDESPAVLAEATERLSTVTDQKLRKLASEQFTKGLADTKSALSEIDAVLQRTQAAGPGANPYVEIFRRATTEAEAFHAKLEDLTPGIREELEQSFRSASGQDLQRQLAKVDDQSAVGVRGLEDLKSKVSGRERGSNDTDVDRLFNDVLGLRSDGSVSASGIDAAEARKRLLEAAQGGRIDFDSLTGGRKQVLLGAIDERESQLKAARGEAEKQDAARKAQAQRIRDAQERTLATQLRVYETLVEAAKNGGLDGKKFVEALVSIATNGITANVGLDIDNKTAASSPTKVTVSDGSVNLGGRLLAEGDSLPST